MKKFFFTLFVVLIIFLNFASEVYPIENIQARFHGAEKLVYKVSFNGLNVGKIEWKYLGKKILKEKEVDVLSVCSDTHLLEFFNLTSKEKVFLDSSTLLPLKVERDVIFFTNKELIQECYDQEHGKIRILRSNSKKEELISQDKPIHNILALLYFFPKDIVLKEGKILEFNLPTQKFTIRVVKHSCEKTKQGQRKVCYLIGKGQRSFKLWLDTEERFPVRLEFMFLFGKVVISNN